MSLTRAQRVRRGFNRLALAGDGMLGQKNYDDNDARQFIETSELPPDVEPGAGRSIWGDLGAAAVCIAAVGLFFYDPPKRADLIIAIAGGLLAIVVMTTAWFWIVASAIAAVALACTAMACIIHFMIFEAVLAVFGTIISIVIMRIAVNRLLL